MSIEQAINYLDEKLTALLDSGKIDEETYEAISEDIGEAIYEAEYEEEEPSFVEDDIDRQIAIYL